MPKMIGNRIDGASEIEANALASPGRIRLSYSQAKLLPAGDVMASLDTTDRGAARTRAKRWYRWFASPEAIERCPRSTKRMRDAVVLSRLVPVVRFFRCVAVAATEEHELAKRHIGRQLANAAVCAATMQVAQKLQMADRVCDERRPYADRMADESVLLDAVEESGIDRDRAIACLWHARRRFRLDGDCARAVP